MRPLDKRARLCGVDEIGDRCSLLGSGSHKMLSHGQLQQLEV